MAQAVAYLHGRGVIHRDLKSSNILLEGDGVKLVDFGTAQLLSSLRRDTQVFLGTPAYMAPEMITGETNHPSVDVFALGVLAYRVLTLEWPVNPEVRDATHWSQAYARHTIPRLDSKVSVPVDVADLVTRMLSPRAVERPDAAAVVQAFSAG
ncbi:MAG: protein kinase [Flavobacteriales bacterium]|nr:protein kinase [Flavobacteriales bacterium]